jgi:cytochrome o ubiquinol oxidase subunit II
MRRLFLCVTLALALPGCSAILDPAGPVGMDERTILLNSLAIMLAVVVPTIAATLGVAFWFRRSNPRAEYRPEWAYSGRLELLVWAIPALVILFLGGIAWLSSHRLDPSRPLRTDRQPLEVQVVALDWKWLFIYPEQRVATVNYLVAPVQMPLRLRITSASVFNGFFVPRLGSQIYAMNGMVTELNLQADQPGTYAGLSSHFSGDGFSDMSFEVRAVPARDFASWAAATRGEGGVLDEAAYRALLRQSSAVAPYAYRAVTEGLFDDIVTGRLPPGDGPSLQAGAVASGTGR